MIGRIVDVVGFFPVEEKQCDVFKERGLVCFNGEVIVGLALQDQVIGEAAPGEKSVGSDNLALDVERIKKGNSCFDLVCALGLLIFPSRKEAYFFRVWQLLV